MKNCEHFQELIDEILALGGSPAEYPSHLERHLTTCQECQAFSHDGLLLNQALDEPLPLPPADLAKQVMQRIQSSQIEEVKLPWAERLAWAASGAIAMFCLERIPEYSASWWSELEQATRQMDWLMATPLALSASSLVAAALSLLAVQGLLVYKTRTVLS